MTEIHSENCIVCAEEFSTEELQSKALSTINSTKFKVCEKCLAMSNPEEDYKQVRDIVQSYLKTSSIILFQEANNIIKSSK